MWAPRRKRLSNRPRQGRRKRQGRRLLPLFLVLLGVLCVVGIMTLVHKWASDSMFALRPQPLDIHPQDIHNQDWPFIHIVNTRFMQEQGTVSYHIGTGSTDAIGNLLSSNHDSSNISTISLDYQNRSQFNS